MRSATFGRAGGTGSEGGALWLFCACATAIADEIPARTEGVEAAMITMCVLLALLLLVDALTIREVTKYAKWKATEATESKPESDQRAEAKTESLWRGLQARAAPAPSPEPS